jgi:predicted Ser/Thr protein kinase
VANEHGSKILAAPAQSQSSGARTEVLPVGRTEVLPVAAQFAPGPRTQAARRRSGSRPPIDLANNMQIGRFGLIRELARGGMGQVFLARDPKLGRKVAIKFLLYADPALVSRFLIEARATAQCTHENIVTIYEVGEHDGLPYMVLEYLEGKTLAQMLDSRIPVRQFTELMLPVARALERAHEHGIVHRDLKPSNIFITARGQVKVLDFGVARIFGNPNQVTGRIPLPMIDRANAIGTSAEAHSDAFTEAGTLIGTLPYMSPEQWGAAEVDQRADIWAIGIMFWRALTGAHPLGSLSADALRDHMLAVDRALPSVRSHDSTIPADLVAIVDGCLAKHKAQRPTATQLLGALQAFLAPRVEQAGGPSSPPYRGLAAFGEGDAKYFFGRSNEIRIAVGQLENWPLLAIVGPSGVGKSSFVHAGLVPAIRATADNWQVRVLRPGHRPLSRLASMLDDLLPTGKPGSDMLAQLHGAPGLFGELTRLSATRRNQRVMIVVDQLEELFTLCEDAEERRLFLTALLAAADDASAPVRVVLSMRADFLDRLGSYKAVLAELTRGLLFLSAPDEGNLREALLRPAELEGYGFEDPEIVDEMLATATSRGALPLLSFVASRLWEARDRTRKLLTVAAYRQMGGVGGAFARHADQVVAAVPPPSQPLLRAMMTRLVTPENTRAVVDYDDLVGLASDRGDGERIVDQLVRARLVHMHTGVDHRATVEIVHETLITEWPTLRRWLDNSHALRGFLHEVEQAARTWAARGRPNDLVWRGASAHEALGTVRRHVLVLSVIEREFLAAVRSQRARSRRRKLLAFSAIAAALCLVIAGGAIAFVQVSRANAEAQRKAIDADTARLAAQGAEAKVRKQLDDVNAAIAAKERAEHEQQAAETKAHEAEGKAKVFEGAAKLSSGELERRNLELKHALAAAQAEKARAVDATDAAVKVSAALEAALVRERDRVRRLELEKAKIYSGGLK